MAPPTEAAEVVQAGGNTTEGEGGIKRSLYVDWAEAMEDEQLAGGFGVSGEGLEENKRVKMSFGPEDFRSSTDGESEMASVESLPSEESLSWDPQSTSPLSDCAYDEDMHVPVSPNEAPFLFEQGDTGGESEDM